MWQMLYREHSGHQGGCRQAGIKVSKLRGLRQSAWNMASEQRTERFGKPDGKAATGSACYSG